MSKCIIHGNVIETDNGKVDEEVYKNLKCPKCGKPPVFIDGVGYVDACIGKKIEGVESICCGHGIHTAYVIFKDGARIPEYFWNQSQ